ncbi:unnamed protein product [Prorocentrum cordatum]|uniref:Protein SDA1 n=1 Tax=Prorocentrum cordatum TaxID=2364126 RepID=A0ABN9VTQ3_9DINO|nr:unnamed protein product [Polarella glacialis]
MIHKTKEQLESEDPEEDAEFKRTLRQVLDFVTPQLGNAERRHYEEAKIRALGGTLEKRQKMPYKTLQVVQKKQEAKRQAALEEEKILGVSTSASAHRSVYAEDKAQRKRKEMAKEKRRRQQDGIMRLGMGAKEKGGLAVLPRSAVYRAQRAGRR